MDWPRYKRLCDRPDVCSRWMLERTLAVLEGGPVAAELRRILEAGPLPRPAEHFGPPDTDMFVVGLDPAYAAAALEAVLRSAANGRLATVSGLASPVGFVAAWREFAAFLDVPEGGAGPVAG